MPYLGQHVMVRTRDGAMHHGILHSVTNDGIYLRPSQGRTRLAASHMLQSTELLMNLNQSEDMQEVWWPFWFFPWWGIAGFWPWFWW